MKYSILLSLFTLAPLVALAAGPMSVRVVQPVAQGAFAVGIGSQISITLPGKANDHLGLFLGKVTEGNGDTDSYIFLDESAGTIDYVPAALVKIGDDDLQSIYRLYGQAGDTCTAYAIDDMIQQMHLSGFVGNGSLSQTLSTEEGRTQLLANAISEYYLEPQHRYSAAGILNGFGKAFGFKCKARYFGDASSIRKFLVERLATGSPVAIGFYIGPDMFNAPVRLIDYSTGKKKDNRLWIPRRIGEKNSGGHTVVAAASFIEKQHLELVMLDSDWDAPRIWDFDKVFGPKTAFKEIEFDVCHSTSP